jgi:germination protein M
MRKLVWLLLAAMLLLVMSGCTLFNNEEEPPPLNGDRPPEPQANVRETVFYLPDAGWQVLMPVRTDILWEEGIARATVGYLMDGNVPQSLLNLGLAPLLPTGTEILGISIRDGVARLDLSEDFLKFNPDNERMVIYGLVYTLTEFPTINKVEILVEGQNVSSANVPLDRAAGINLEIADTVTDVEQAERITLYYLYPVGEQAYYVPVTRVVNKTEDVLATTAQELLRGPSTGSPLFTALPPGISLQSVSVEGSKLTLRLSDNFTVTGGQLAADRIQRQLALTFTEIPGVMEIEVLAGGAAPEFPPGVRFPTTFSRPRQWNLVGANQ